MKKDRVMRTSTKDAFHQHAEIRKREIDNPFYSKVHAGNVGNPEKIEVEFNVRESAVSAMFSKGLLQKHQVEAADRFRRLWESMGASGAGSFDYSRPLVDGGGARESLSERQFDAGKQINDIRTKVLTIPRMFDIVVKVAGEGYSVASIGTTHRERTTLADYLKDGLDLLAIKWGYKNRGKSGRKQQRQ